ncbi:MAG TPA: TolC family protein, partial [Gemmatimonadaceae bacterium]
MKNLSWSRVIATLVIVAPLTAQTPAPVRLTLGDATRAAAERSAPAEIARIRIDEANARVRQAKSALYPNFSGAVLQSGRTFNTATFGLDLPGFDPNGEVKGPVNTLDLRGRVAQTIWDGSANARVNAAKSGVASASADATAAGEAAAGSAAVAYVRAQRAEEQLRSRVADSTLSAELLKIARDMLEAGVGIALDVTRAESQLAGFRAQLIAARNERSRSRLELLRVIGLPLDTPVELVDSLSTPATEALPTQEAAVDAALRQRADLRATEQQLAALRTQVSAIRAERLPSVGLVADDGLIGKKFDHLLPTYTWGVQLSVPVFDGYRRDARIQEQTAVAREVEVRQRDLRAQVGVEVRGALLDLSSARELVEAGRERVRLADQEVSQARDRFS